MMKKKRSITQGKFVKPMARHSVAVFTLCLSLFIGAAGRAWGEVETRRINVQITMSDGVILDAILVEPVVAGPHPIAVLPSAWATEAETFIQPATELAEEGFVVVSYTSRGFFESGGVIDVAGSRTVKDVSEVIDWAIASTDGDPERIGALGVSYGAGCSLLAAARDPRIDAVAALSAWGDLEAAVFPNETVSQAAIELLEVTADDTGTPSMEMNAMLAALENGNYNVARAFASTRSPINEVAAINANGTPVFIANAWNDSIFPPSQIIHLFHALTVPKRILLLPGDHATPEAPSAFGIPTASFDGAYEWFAAYVRDGQDVDGPKIKITSNDPDGEQFVGDSFDQLVATKTLYLSQPTAENGSTGSIAASSSVGWRHQITGGTDTVADSGPIVLTGFVQQVTPAAPFIALNQVNRTYAAVWESAPLGGGDIIGSPVVAEDGEGEFQVMGVEGEGAHVEIHLGGGGDFFPEDGCSVGEDAELHAAFLDGAAFVDEDDEDKKPAAKKTGKNKD